MCSVALIINIIIMNLLAHFKSKKSSTVRGHVSMERCWVTVHINDDEYKFTQMNIDKNAYMHTYTSFIVLSKINNK